MLSGEGRQRADLGWVLTSDVTGSSNTTCALFPRPHNQIMTTLVHRLGLRHGWWGMVVVFIIFYSKKHEHSFFMDYIYFINDCLLRFLIRMVVDKLYTSHCFPAKSNKSGNRSTTNYGFCYQDGAN